jgi:ribonucleoside-diphosphate reductase alpha chain
MAEYGRTQRRGGDADAATDGDATGADGSDSGLARVEDPTCDACQ